MAQGRQQEVLGILFIVLGVLFILVINGLMWFGWEALWPAFPLLIGLFLLRIFVVRRKPRQLFLGTFLTLFSVFFFTFSSGIRGWETMAALWPTFPLITGISLIAVAGVSRDTSSPLVIGLGFIVFAIMGYLGTGGVVSSRLSEPIRRFWPLVLVGVGVLVYLRGRRVREEAAIPPLDVASPPRGNQTTPAAPAAPKDPAGAAKTSAKFDD